jgi:hypothetical protein
VIDAAVPWVERIPNGLTCESGRIYLTLRAHVPSSCATLRLFRFDGTFATLEQVDTALMAARCRPATLHHLVAFMAAYRIGVHGRPGRLLAIGSTEALPQAEGGALLVPHVKVEYDIDAECVEGTSLELEKIFSRTSSGIGSGDYILAVEETET